MTAWTPGTVVGDLDADYHQVELHVGLGGQPYQVGDLGLMNGEFGDHVTLTVARQYGTMRFQVEVTDLEPPLDPSWDAVAEFSLRTGEPVVLTGWAGGGSLTVPVPPEVDARLRYVVLGGEVVADHPPTETQDGVGVDRYLVQVWPNAPAVARVVVSTSPWSQYWTFGQEASQLLIELADFPDPDRLVQVIDRALAVHPDVAQQIRGGDERYRVGVIRYLQELFRITFFTGAYDDVRDDHEHLALLIDQRARRSAR